MQCIYPTNSCSTSSPLAEDWLNCAKHERNAHAGPSILSLIAQSVIVRSKKSPAVSIPPATRIIDSDLPRETLGGIDIDGHGA